MKSIPRLLGSLSILLFSSLAIPSLQAATINVTDTTDAFDGSVCTLRNAIESMNNGADFGGCANSSPDAYGTNDTITLTAQTYVLSLGTTNEDDNADGDLDISVSVNITGAGADQTAVSGSGFPDGEEDRVFHVIEPIIGTGGFVPVITVNIEGLTIRDGGGLLNNNGLLTLDNSLVTQNIASSDGGALQNDVTAMTVIRNSTLDDNFAPDDGGAIIEGTLILVNSTVSNNEAGFQGGGIFVVNQSVSGDGGPSFVSLFNVTV
ncbi:MAG TPA: hypothetical protein VJP40_03835, partial [bacterium]|nr:hypothetical protein [bacterium]